VSGARRRAFFANAALALASLAVFAAGAELAARRFDLRPAAGAALANPPWLGNRWLLRQTYRDELAQAGLLARYYDLYEWDRYLFFRLRPNASLDLLDVFAPPAARDRTRWSVRTNSRGFRTPEFETRPAPGRLRIAVLGDSSTFGWGVAQSEAYPERLRAALAERLRVAPERIEVINLGVPGYSSFQGLAMLRRVALALAPDLVVWSYLSNDGAATGEDDLASYVRREGPVGAVLEALHASRAFETLESWIAVARSRVHPALPPDPRDPAQRNVPSYQVARGNVRAAVEAAHRAGVPIALVGQCIRGAPAQVMTEVARETGTPHLDATALLDASLPVIAEQPGFAADRQRVAARYGASEVASNPRLLAFLPDGCHPNPLGHRLVADALAELLAPQLAQAKP
jgi:lysophospholipase L1-like esterase